MGVKGLWKLLEPTGKPVTLESLQGKILAVDLSLWIHQAIRGCAGRSNEKNAHLIVLFNRICKLLFYGVRPVFVFDGPEAPHFKKHTLTKRKMKRDEAAQTLSKIQRKLLKRLAAEALSEPKQKEKRQKIDDPCNSNLPSSSQTSQSFDEIEIEETVDETDEESDVEFISEIPTNVDINSADFSALPAETLHDILLNLRENARMRRRCVSLPEESDDFSKFQLKNLLKRSKINQKLDEIQKNLIVAHASSLNLPTSKEFKLKNVFHGDRRRHFLFEAKEKSNDDDSTRKIDEEDEEEINSNFKELNSSRDDDNSSDEILELQEIILNHSTNVSKPVEKKVEKIETQETRNSPEIEEFSEVKIPSNDEIFVEKVAIGEESTTTTNNLKKNSFPKEEEKNLNSAEIVASDNDDSDSFVEVEQIPVVDVDDLVCSEHEEKSMNLENQELVNSKICHEEFIDGGKNSSKIVESLEELRDRRRKAEAIDKTLNTQLIEECQALLNLFGMPFVISPGEAEAQCATLENLRITGGTVTEDSDVWLFGGRSVYRHVFDKRHFVQKFESNLIEKSLGLTREKLILLALLVGCDYTAGVGNVGVVAALEILSEFGSFDDEKVGVLREFKNWWDECQKRKIPPGNLVRSRLMNSSYVFPPSFPDAAIFAAFLRPNVDEKISKSSLEWSAPDVDELRSFASRTFGWTREKTDNILLPAVRKFAAAQETKNQTLITNFSFTLVPEVDKSKIFRTNRVKNAVDKLKNDKNNDDSEEILPLETRKKSKQKIVVPSTSRRPKRKAKRAALKKMISVSELISSESD